MRAARIPFVITIVLGTSLLASPFGGVATAANDPQGTTTLDQTIKKKGSGFKKLVAKGGEPYHVRTDMVRASKHRAQHRRSMTFFGQLTDPQLADEMSPARTELVDPASGSISAAWRPQEALGPFVFDATIRSMNRNSTSRVRQGDGEYADLQYAILTGDIADSQQLNEVDWFRRILDGERVDPFTGQKVSNPQECTNAFLPLPTQQQLDTMNAAVEKRKYTGVQDFDDWPGQPTRYSGFWDPNVGGTSNEYGYGSFPTYPGLMDRAQEKFTAAGLNVPWYITRGNHDTLVQGNVPANLEVASVLEIGSIATGCRKPWPNAQLDPNVLKGIPSGDVFEVLTQPQNINGILYGLLSMEPVPPDADRRYVSKVEFKKKVGGGDRRHGFDLVSQEQLDSSRGNASYYGVNQGRFRILMLDSNAEGGGSQGNIDDPQYQWLEHQLDKYSTVQLTKNGKIKKDAGNNKLLIIASHHTIASMDNTTPDEEAGTCDDPMEPGCDSDPRDSEPIHLGAKGKQPIEDLLLRYPNVIAYVNGHTHHNKVTAYKRPKSAEYAGGFWQVNTASHVDWPQQSRVIEIMNNRDNTLSIFGTILDSAAPVKAPQPGTKAKKLSNKELAAVSRRIAANDPQSKDVTDGGGPGTAQDRNVELILQDPRQLWTVRGMG